MSTLANILPAAGTDSFDNDRATALAGPPEKNGEPFDHLMARALSPSPTEANPAAGQNPPTTDDSGNSKLQTKNAKSSAQISGKDRAKSGGDNSAAATPSAPLDTSIATVNPENILMQTVALVEAKADQANGLNAKASPDVSFQGQEAAVANKPADGLTALPGSKNISAADATASSLAGSKDQPGRPEKITAAVEALAVGKANPADSKIASQTAPNPQVSPLARDAAGDLTTPKLIAESFAKSLQPEFSASSNLAAKTAAQAQPDVNGTPVAQQDVPMKKTEKPNKTDSPAGKFLPGAAVSGARVNNLPARESFSTQALTRSGQNAANVAGSSAQSDGATDIVAISTDSANSTASAATADFRSRTLERAQDMIVMHATRLSDAGNSLLQVVIKPGAGTQLSLELRQRGDGVDATAVLQRGDFGHLNQQWPALQQQLEQRGIRLAPLVSREVFFTGDAAGAFQNKQNQTNEPESFAEATPAGSFAQTVAHAGTYRGWETWA
jgi:hypothetical protein